MKISIITPVLNGELYIRQTIESVLNQKGDFHLEYIVKDGGSSDKTLEILEEYKDRCIIISQKDGSPQEAINSGMALATGDIAAYLNADDVFEANALQFVASEFKKNPKCQWLYGRCKIVDSHNNKIRRFITLYKNIIGYKYSKYILLLENYINQPATFWKMDLWKKVGGLNSKHLAAFDYELWLKMAEIAPAKSIHTYLARFRRHTTSISENNFTEQFKEELQISKTYGTSLQYYIHKLTIAIRILIYKIIS